MNPRKVWRPISMLVLVASIAAGCSAGPLSTREKAAGIGAVGGAAAGAIVGSTVGHAGSGAAIGGALGLGAGALIGDKLQSQEQRVHRAEAGRYQSRQEMSQSIQQQGEY